MKIEIKLITTLEQTPLGFPLVVNVSHQGKRKQKTICFCKENHFNQDMKMITEKHPDFDLVAPVIFDLKIRAKKIIYSNCQNVNLAFDELFKKDNAQILFYDFAKKLIADMQQMATALAKIKDLKAQNKILGNIRVYQNVLAQFEPFTGNLTLQNLDFDVLTRFRNYQTGIGNSKSTVHLYLRTLRAIYNKGVALHKLENKKPFTGIFAGLKQRSFNNKKKYLNKETVQKLAQLDLKTAKQKYIDLFLLQFYFAGCDLVDLYYLKNAQIRGGRVIFERNKTNTGARISLKIHPKAQTIIEKYKTPGEWLFNFKKDKASYETFRRTYQRALIYVQEKTAIEVLPDGGNMGVKVARHTFANLAKLQMIDPDIIRELMGHERDDVDNFYKDKYPEEMRDFALFEIISPFGCLK